jgi:branched-chain amino acid transport system substrate-binding protein
MSRRLLRHAVVAVALAGTLAGCGKAAGPPTAPQVLRLGALVPLTGDSAPIGSGMVHAFQMAVDEANAEGGVLGRRVELVTGDDACDPGTAVVQANELVAKGITASVGGLCSAATVPTLKVFRAAGVPMIIPGANSTELLTPRYDSVFLLAGTTAIEAQHAVAWAQPLGARRLALVGDGTSFSGAIVAAAAATVKQPGSGIALAAELELTQGATAYPQVVETVLREQADLVFYTGYHGEAATLIRDLRAANYTGKIMLSDGGCDPALLKELSAAQAEGVYGLALPLPEFEPRAASWAVKYRASTGAVPGPFTMQAYDAVKLALDAVRRAGSTDRAAVRQAISATTPTAVQLLSGPSQFNPDGMQVDSTFIQLRIHDGAFVLAAKEG